VKLAEGRKKTRINSVNGRRLYLYPNVVKRHLATTMQRNNNDNVLIFFLYAFTLTSLIIYSVITSSSRSMGRFLIQLASSRPLTMYTDPPGPVGVRFNMNGLPRFSLFLLLFPTD